MKKLIFLILLFPAVVSAQFDGVMIMKNKAVVTMNSEYINYFTRNISRISSWRGQTEIAIPYEKTFFLNTKGMFIDGYFIQFDYDGSDVTLKKVDTRYIVFDFEKDKISEKDKNDDDEDPKHPKDLEKLKDKIKDKIK